MQRKMLTSIGLLLCGTCLGALAGGALSRVLQVRHGEAQLQAYAERLRRVGEQLASETRRAIGTVKQDTLPFCSDQQIDWMRDFVFNAVHVKDIGRSRDGKLICTTGLGRLTPPWTNTSPDVSIDGLNIFLHTPLLLSHRSNGLIAERDGISIVLNPEAYKTLDEPPMYFAGYLADPQAGRVFYGFGHPMPLTDKQILAGSRVRLNGIVYIPLCAPEHLICVVAAESRQDMLSRSGKVFDASLVFGALFGAAAAVILILFIRRRGSLERQLFQAIRSGAITLVYQPIVDLRNDVIVGVEALARWTTTAGEPIRPEVFIALAEESGSIRQLTQLVVHSVIEQLGDILAEGDFCVSINITPQDLADPGFAGHLASTLRDAKVPASSIGLELTERSTANQQVVIAAIAALRRLGHPVYIDDFGTGYSSLAYLHHLAVDAIKIDRIFTQTVGTDAVTASVVPQILAMARELNLSIVVEGIETSEQAQYFRDAEAGILGQGWFLGRPVPAILIREKLRARMKSVQLQN